MFFDQIQVLGFLKKAPKRDISSSGKPLWKHKFEKKMLQKNTICKIWTLKSIVLQRKRRKTGGTKVIQNYKIVAKPQIIAKARNSATARNVVAYTCV